MAGAQRKPDPPLSERIASEAKTFGFFSAVQLLHRLAPKALPVGESGPPGEEAIRFGHDPTLGFATSDITSIEVLPKQPGRPRFKVTTTFLGLFGATGPLSSYMSEEVLRSDEDGTGLRQFYDIFHHRLLSLFFRAWKKYRFAAGFRSDAGDRFTPRALAFAGLDLAGALPRHGLPPGELLALAPLVALRTRPSRSLQIVLERLFPGTSVRIESFVPRRVTIDAGQRVRLGVQNCTLGQDLTIGRSVVDRAGAFRVVIGPVSYEAFESFVPGGRYHVKLRNIIDQFSGGILEPQLDLQLAEDATPRFQLGGGGRGARLGVTTQLVTKRTKPMRVRITLSESADRSASQVVTDDDDLAAAE